MNLALTLKGTIIKLLLDKLVTLKSQIESIGLVMSDNAKYVWKQELDNEDYKNYNLNHYSKLDFSAPFASGSANYNIMIICPASMGTIGRIANGISNDLTTRAADVVLKERRKLILAIRETPFSEIHLENMLKLARMGVSILPPIPAFYNHPETIDDLIDHFVGRILDQLGVEANFIKRWDLCYFVLNM